MNSKDFEKMLDIMISLEPMNPRSVETEKFDDQGTENYQYLEDASFKSRLKNRKQSLPMSLSTPSLGSRATIRRESLFHNDMCYSKNSLQRLTLCPGITNDLWKNTPKIECANVINDERLLSQDFIRSHKNVNVYEEINPKRGSTMARNSKSIHSNRNSDDGRDTLTSIVIDCRKQSNLTHKNSLELLKMKELKQSKSSEIVSNIIPENIKYSLSSSQSPENIPDNWLSRKNTGASSAESKSTYVFTEFPKSNNNTLTRPDSNIGNSFSCHGGISTPPTAESDLELISKPDDIRQQKSISNIISDEEQNKFYRDISNKLSLDSFSTKEIIKFFMRSGIFSAQIVDKFQTAASVCKSLKQKYLINEGTYCHIIEVISKESLERPLEDHENILEIFSSWKEDNICNKFIFEENPCQTTLFDEPMTLPDSMKHDFEITDFMWVKPANSKWIRVTCFIKDKCIYYSLKQGSKDQKDMYCLVNLTNADFYTCTDVKKIKRDLKAPTMDLIVFKENKSDHRVAENVYIAPLHSNQKEKWLEALAVAKFSLNQLKINHSQHRNRLVTEIGCDNHVESVNLETKYQEQSSSI